MDNKMFVLYASALLSTLNQESAPSGSVYAAFMTRGITFEQYADLLAILKAKGLVVETGHLLSLTIKGKELANKVDLVMRG